MKLFQAGEAGAWLNRYVTKISGAVLIILMTVMFLNSMLDSRDGRSGVVSREGTAEYSESEKTAEEVRLENILECINGVGSVKVMISGGGTGSSEMSVFAQNDNETEETKGVIVAAEGAGNPAVQCRITDAVSTVCGISPSDVIVFEMRN